MSDTLQTALNQCCLIRLADRLGIQIKMGLQKSPFRDEKKPSFSVFTREGVTLAKDHASGQVFNAWSFAEEANPDLSKGEIARLIKEVAGVQDSPLTKAERKAWAKEKRDLERARVLKRERERAAVPPPPIPCEPWPDFVQERYREGWLNLRLQIDDLEKIAKSRGFGLRFCSRVVSAGDMARPVLPWYRIGEKGARRGVAFPVKQPHFERDRLTVETIGYHTRFSTQDGGKAWLYVPYCPSEEKPARSRFEAILSEKAARVPAWPFVQGDFKQPPRVLAVLEGQWDALAFSSAWNGDFPGPVFGIRGASSVGLFLAGYGMWLKRYRPAVWLFPDADKAGDKWTDDRNPDKICLRDKLQAFGCRVITEKLKTTEFKDFNDFYKARKPGREYMAAWAAKRSI